MATAYDHLTPYKRLSTFVFHRIYEEQESIKALEAEIRMWEEPEVKNIMEGFASRTPQYLNREQLVFKVRNALEFHRLEIKFWQNLEKELNQCPGCNGTGELRTIIDVDESKYEKCNACDGTGKNK